MPNPTEEISKRIRSQMILTDRKRADLRVALAPTTSDNRPMSDSAIGRRLAGELTWDVHELAIVAEFLGVPVADLLPETSDAEAS